MIPTDRLTTETKHPPLAVEVPDRVNLSQRELVHWGIKCMVVDVVLADSHVYSIWFPWQILYCILEAVQKCSYLIAVYF